VTRRPSRWTVKPALNGASHGTSTRQTGVIGPRTTTPARPVVGDGPADAHARTPNATKATTQWAILNRD
jgi:hypothetical protein